MIQTILCAALLVGETIELKTKDTLTAVELNVGDSLRFTLRNGRTRTIAVEAADARELLTNIRESKKGFYGGGTLYEMTCRVRVDGHPMTMRRYVPVQESFYVPYVVNGMRIWFDGVRKVESFLNDNHGGGVPRKDVRFAIQDASLPICPEELRPWYPNRDNFIDVGESYNANDVWMGPYFGADLHGGLDINMPIGTPLWAPMDFDTQFYFNSLKAGHNNNRWRGIRTWPNGERWVLQAHHIVKLLVPENTPLKRGVHYAETAGTLTGSHAHSHFVFKIGPEDDEVLLDAWIPFWQIFENNRRRAGAIRAAIRPFGPARTGEAAAFSGEGSSPGVAGHPLSYQWSFGDGSGSTEAKPNHTFLKSGLYPVTLVVDDGVDRATVTHHVTVDGDPVDRPALSLEAPDRLSFRTRPADVMDVYGRSVSSMPRTLRFLARPRTSPRPAPGIVFVKNAGKGSLPPPKIRIRYREGAGWLTISAEDGMITVQTDAGRLKNRSGFYRADVIVECAGALNSPQSFGVRLDVPRPRDVPPSSVVVDDRDPGCEATPWTWVSPEFHRHFPKRWPPGYRGGYRVNVGSPANDARIRFTPDLRAGTYDVSFPDTTPSRPNAIVEGNARFAVRIRHLKGMDTVWVEPLTSRNIGTYDFAEGSDGYIEILAEGSRGIVVADAIRFERR